MYPKEIMFSSLPYELFQHILLFAVDQNLSDTNTRSSHISLIAKFQSLNKKFNTIKEMEDYFNKFWWSAFTKTFGINKCLENDLEKLKLEMIRKQQLKRKFLLARYVKFKLWKQTQPVTTNREEAKIVMLGEGACGKTSLTLYFSQGYFFEEYDPTIEDVYRRREVIDGVPVFFDILDTAGPEEYSALREQYIRTGDAFSVVCALDSKSSLKELRYFCDLIVRVRETGDVPIVFAINKLDKLENNPQKEQIIEQYISEIECVIKDVKLGNTSIIQTSAKTGENVTPMFVDCARRKMYSNEQFLTLLENVIEKDSRYIEELRKGQSKKCSIM